MPGAPEPGVYPIRPWNRTWYIDKNRKKPVLSVARYQLPLAPAFAITAHASQGQTLEAAIVDLHQGVGVSTIASYVAMTRVRKRSDLLIYRPFDKELFRKGALQGPTLLLRVMRGEAIDWEEITEALLPKKRCVGCNERKEKTAFWLADWKDAEDGRRRECSQEKILAGAP